MPWGLKKRFNHQIHVAKADYILSLKANHPTLFGQVDAWFKAALAEGTLPLPSEHTTESGHHRTEIRKVWTVSVDSFSSLYQAEAWAGLQTILVIERTRHLWHKTTHEIQFYLHSVCRPIVPELPRRFAPLWSIENSLHWALDVTFAEDDCRVRALHAPHNLASCAALASMLSTLESSSKRSYSQKSKRSAMDDAYMLSVLAAALPDPIENSDPSCQ